LYERVTVRVEDEFSLDNIDVSLLLRTRHTPKNLLRHIKNIEIVSRFHVNTTSRCIHAWGSDEDDEAEPSGLSRQAANLRPLLEGCRDNSLRNFTYVFCCGG
jgi:hypothetical protein